MSLCRFDTETKRCPACGYVAKRLPTFRECRPVPENRWRPVQVGDLVEKMLTRVGITKERVERWTRTEGKPGGCGCESRKRWMNDVGNKAQIAARSKFQKLRRFYFGD